MGVSLRVTPNGRELLVPYGRGPVAFDGDYVSWREAAACRDVEDPEIFSKSKPHLDRVNFPLALAFCEGCSVREECLTESSEEDREYTIRGGVAPQFASDSPIFEGIDCDALWELYCQRADAADQEKVSGRTGREHSRLVGALMDRHLLIAHTATWDDHRNLGNQPIPAGAGWVVSISPAGTTYGVITTGIDGRRYVTMRLASYVTLSPGVVTGSLPVLKNLPKVYL